MKLAVDTLSAILEFLLLSYFCNRFFKNKISSKIVIAISGLLFIFTNFFISMIALKTAIAPFLFISGIFCYTFLYREKLIKRSLYTLMFCVLGILAEALIGTVIAGLNNVTISETQTNIYLYANCLILSKLFLIALFRLIGLYITDKTIDVDGKTVIPIILIEVSSIISIYYLAIFAYKANNFISSVEVFVIIVIVISANISTFYLLENQIRLQKSKDDFINLQSQYKLQKEYYSELKENMITTNQSTHDIKNFITAISAYIDDKKVDVAKKKIDEFYGKIPMLNELYTDNMAVNALIKSKIQDIHETIPESCISVIIPDQMAMDEIDLCILLGNAIDNAIEGCKKVVDRKKRLLVIKIFPVDSQLSILVKNSKAASKPDPYLLSTKPNGFKHGFGIKNMRSIVENYCGNISFEQTESTFTVSVLLPI